MTWLRKSWAWLLLAALLALAVFGLMQWFAKDEAPRFKTVKIEKGSITASVSASGTLSPVVSVQVGSQVSGQLKEVLVDFNSEVRQGQLIARLDPETFEYRVRQAQADLEAAGSLVMTQQANIAAQQAEVSKAEVNRAEAGRDLERKQQLVEKGFIAAAERDKAQAAYNVLVEQVKTAQAQAGVAAANARNAEAVVKQRQAALAQARIDLGRTEIKAPVSGVVIKRSVERGQTVAASLQAPELFIIAENLADMQVDAAIDESEIGRVRTGQKATFTVDAFPGRSFEGEVKQIRKAARTESNVVTYTVVISASNPNRELLPGMTANVRVVTESREDILKVANAALRYRPGGARPEAADAQSGGPSARSGAQMRAMRERLETELALSAEQKARLDTIFTGMAEKAITARTAAEGERQKIMGRNRSEMRAQITELLTPEQKVKYQQILAETDDRRGGVRGRIYTLDENGEPKVLQVRFGLTDGTTTEVMSPEVKEGMEVIVGSALQQQNRPGRPQANMPRMF
jgi:HlyD family secretion protein